jgi:hypothetical protein
VHLVGQAEEGDGAPKRPKVSESDITAKASEKTSLDTLLTLALIGEACANVDLVYLSGTWPQTDSHSWPLGMWHGKRRRRTATVMTKTTMRMATLIELSRYLSCPSLILP